MDIHTHPEFFFIFYSKKIGIFFFTQSSQIRQIFTLPQKYYYYYYYKFKKINGFYSKRKEKKKRGKFCPQKKLVIIL